MQSDSGIAGLVLLVALWALIFFVWVDDRMEKHKLKKRNALRKINCVGCGDNAVGVILLDAKDVSKSALCDVCWLRWHRIAALEKELDNDAA